MSEQKSNRRCSISKYDTLTYHTFYNIIYNTQITSPMEYNRDGADRERGNRSEGKRQKRLHAGKFTDAAGNMRIFQSGSEKQLNGLDLKTEGKIISEKNVKYRQDRRYSEVETQTKKGYRNESDDFL